MDEQHLRARYPDLNQMVSFRGVRRVPIAVAEEFGAGRLSWLLQILEALALEIQARRLVSDEEIKGRVEAILKGRSEGTPCPLHADVGEVVRHVGDGVYECPACWSGHDRDPCDNPDCVCQEWPARRVAQASDPR